MSSHSIEGVVTMIFMFLIVLFSVLGNAITIAASWRFSNLRTTTHILIVNLAVSDMLISLLAAPTRILQSFGSFWSNQIDNCRVIIILTLFFCNASVLNLTLISVDRAISIISPLTYNHLSSNTKLFVKIAVPWLASIFIAILPFLGFGWLTPTNASKAKKEVDICRYLSILDKDYVLFVFSSAVFGPFFIMVICHVYMFRVALRHLKRISAAESSIRKTCSYVNRQTFEESSFQTKNDDNKKTISFLRRGTNYRSFLLLKELKAAKMIAMVVGFFALCVVPICIVDIVEIACGYSCTPSRFVTFAVCLSYINPATNIFAYAAISSDYRAAYKKILKSFICCRKKLN